MTTAQVFHIDKTRQDRQKVEDRQRVVAATNRRLAHMFGDRREILRRYNVQIPRVQGGTYDLRHLNALIRYAKEIAAHIINLEEPA